jgi:hypothetical protein
MGTLNIKFKTYPVSADAGYEESFVVDKNDFEITEDLQINSAAFISEDGLNIPVTQVYCNDEGNLIFLYVPNDIPTGFYRFKISVVSFCDPSHTAVIETENLIQIDGESERNNPPIVTSVHFRNHPTTIPAADLTGDFLIVTGNYLDHVTAIKLIAPPVLFTITAHAKREMTVKAISAPRVQGLKLAFPLFEYTITDEQGEFISSGEIRSDMPLRIQGE